MAIYTLSVYDYDYHDEYIIEGPEVEDWNVYCKSLLQEALDLSVSRAQGDEWISGETIVLSLIDILDLKGYTHIDNNNFAVHGGVPRRFPDGDLNSDLPSDYNVDEVADHNMRVEEYNREKLKKILAKNKGKTTLR